MFTFIWLSIINLIWVRFLLLFVSIISMVAGFCFFLLFLLDCLCLKFWFSFFSLFSFNGFSFILSLINFTKFFLSLGYFVNKLLAIIFVNLRCHCKWRRGQRNCFPMNSLLPFFLLCWQDGWLFLQRRERFTTNDCLLEVLPLSFLHVLKLLLLFFGEIFLEDRGENGKLSLDQLLRFVKRIELLFDGCVDFNFECFNVLIYLHNHLSLSVLLADDLMWNMHESVVLVWEFINQGLVFFFNEMLDGLNETHPILVTFTTIIRSWRENEYLELVWFSNRFVENASFGVQSTSLLIFENHCSVHDVFVGLRNNCNQEVEKYHQHQKLVWEPNKPNEVNCTLSDVLWVLISILVRNWCLQYLIPEIKAWWLNVSNWIFPCVQEEPSLFINAFKVLFNCCHVGSYNCVQNSESTKPKHKEHREWNNVNQTGDEKFNEHSKFLVKDHEEMDFVDWLHDDDNVADYQSHMFTWYLKLFLTFS